MGPGWSHRCDIRHLHKNPCLQCNLKQTIGAFDNQQLLPGFLDLRGGDLHTQEELLSLQRLKESVVTPALSQRPVITLASFLPVGSQPLSIWHVIVVSGRLVYDLAEPFFVGAAGRQRGSGALHRCQGYCYTALAR